MRVLSPSLKAVLASGAVTVAALGLVGGASAATVVTAFDSSYIANGQWYQSSLTAGGTASTQSLAGKGGNLEGSAPLSSGAALLTTDNTNGAKTEVSVADNYGKAGDILSSLKLGYDFYRSNAAGQNAAAAPSLKLTFYNPNYVGDGFVTLIYESYWQGSNPTSDVWTHVDIDFSSGLFWQNGGFGQANSAGGPPLNTLSGWLAAFDGGFSDASLVSVTMGLGSYNPGVTGYFDNVSISHSSGNGYARTYDFEADAGTVPEPASLALFGVGLASAWVVARRRGARGVPLAT